jgi:hypothetical protein
MGCAGDKDRSIDKKKFIELVCRIKLTRHWGTYINNKMVVT